MKRGGLVLKRFRLASPAVALLLYLSVPRRADGEGRVDLKTLYYEESGDRMRIISPTVMYEQALSPSMTIRIDGIYNSISGATPSGAPPLRTDTTYSTVTTSGGGSYIPASDFEDGDEEEEDEYEGEEDRQRGRFLRKTGGGYAAKAGATPVATPSTSSGGGGGSNSSTVTNTVTTYDKSGKAPRARVEDERIGFNMELAKQLGRHTIVLQGAVSEESDYTSLGIALKDSIAFNSKNTTVTIGAAYSGDEVDAVTMPQPENKNSLDLMLGVLQLLGKKTTLTVNATVGSTDGYLSDPYKLVELNGNLVAERRPGDKTKQILYVALNRYIDSLNGAAEVSYRYYDDSFGIQAHTAGIAWYQKIGSKLILRPSLRYYMQGAADFYDIQFQGDPEFYSSDYRVSEMSALGYGMKLIWTPIERMSFDIAVDRYVQEGLDGVTADDMYPTAISVMAGVRLWL